MRRFNVLLLALLGAGAITRVLPAQIPPPQQHDEQYWEWVRQVEEKHQELLGQLLPKYQAARKQQATMTPGEVYLLAVCQYYARDFKAAALTAQPLLEISEYKRKSRYLIALCLQQSYVSKNKWNHRGLALLRDALRRNHDDPRVWMAIQAFVLASPLPARNTLIESYINVLRRDHPRHFGPTLLRATRFQTGFKYAEAEKEFLAAYQLAPRNAAVLHALVLFQRVRGDLEGSLKYLRELAALNFNPRYAEELRRDEAALERARNFAQMLAEHPKLVESEEPVYYLPFPVGQAYYLADPAAYSPHPLGKTHVDRGAHAYDFLMPPNSIICAARGGKLVKKVQTGESGGSQEFVNYAVIDHGDGTYGRYFNLVNISIFPKLGETVLAGQPLARSDRNRLTQSAHLHFEVVEKAGYSWSQPSIYQWRKTVPIMFEEFRAIPEGDRSNAWHISQNVPVRIEPE